MQVVITIEGSQADVFEQEPDELVQFSTDGEYTCVDGCGVLTYPESELTGHFEESRAAIDLDSVLHEIESAEEEAYARQARMKAEQEDSY